MKALILVLASSPFLSATDFYFAQNSAGANNGTSCANAYAATRFNTNDSNWTAGNTLHLCGTITSQLTAQASGSAGNPITILAESGVGLSSAAGFTTGFLTTTAKSYLTFDGGTNGIIESTANGTDLANKIDATGINLTNCAHCIVKNWTVRNIYVRTSGSTDANTYGTCIVATGNNVEIKNNSALTCGFTGIAWGGVANETDSDSSIHDNILTATCTALKAIDDGANALMTNFRMYNNDVTLPGGRYDGDPTHVCHSNGFHGFVMGSGSTYTDGGFFYSNYIHGDIGVNNTAFMYFEFFPTGANVFNNLLVNPVNSANFPSNGFVAFRGTTNGGLIANNTMSGSAAGCWLLANPAVTGTKFKNNLCSDTSGPFIISGSSITAADVDYHIYATISATTWHDPSGFDTFAQWQAAGYDPHAINGGSVNLTSDFHPTASSSGANLTSLGISALNSDKAGMPRPATGTWDIGAFNFLGLAPGLGMFARMKNSD